MLDKRGPSGYGYKQDTHGDRLPNFKFAVSRATQEALDKVNFGSSCPGIMDQGRSGSCTGHGSSAAVYTTCKFNGKPLPYIPSPRGMYVVGLSMARARHNPNTPVEELPKLQDEGCMPVDLIAGVQKFGIYAMPNQLTSDGRLSDCTPENVCEEIDLLSLESGYINRFIDPHRLTSDGEQMIQDMKLSMSQGWCMCGGIYVDTAFMNWSPGQGPLNAPPNVKDKNGGPHWIMFRAYDGDLWTIQNSWGIGYGDGGLFYVTSEYLQYSLTDATSYTLKEAA